jgi:hypothetical protein
LSTPSKVIASTKTILSVCSFRMLLPVVDTKTDSNLFV